MSNTFEVFNTPDGLFVRVDRATLAQLLVSVAQGDDLIPPCFSPIDSFAVQGLLLDSEEDLLVFVLDTPERINAGLN